jgi:hypothetical protein
LFSATVDSAGGRPVFVVRSRSQFGVRPSEHLVEALGEAFDESSDEIESRRDRVSAIRRAAK